MSKYNRFIPHIFVTAPLGSNLEPIFRKLHNLCREMEIVSTTDLQMEMWLIREFNLKRGRGRPIRNGIKMQGQIGEAFVQIKAIKNTGHEFIPAPKIHGRLCASM